MFKSCRNSHAIWMMKILKTAEFCFHDVMRQNVVARNEHFVHAFVDVNVVRRNDVFDVWLCKPTPFCTTRINIWNGIILMTFRRFQCDFRLGSVKCKNNDRKCLFHCIYICRVPRKLFELETASRVFKRQTSSEEEMHEKCIWSLY